MNKPLDFVQVSHGRSERWHMKKQEEAKAKLNHGRKLKRNREKNPYDAENSRARRSLRNLTVVDPEPESEVIDLTKDEVIDLTKD